MARVTLAPVDIIARYRNIRTGVLETWSAATKDGVWFIERLEEPGTPWGLYHTPTGTYVGLFGTLRSARRAIVDGTASRMLDARQAGL